MDVDPAASMRCWDIGVELGGLDYVIPAQPAADWWPVLLAADPLVLLDIIQSTDQSVPDIGDRILDGSLAQDDYLPALTEALEEAAGRSFHAAYVLATVANTGWPVVGGQLAQRGFRWDVMPLGAALDAIYAVVLPLIPEKSEDGKRRPRDEFLAMLDNESLTNGKPTERQRTKITNEFEALAGPMPTSGVRSTGAPSGSARSKTRSRPRPPRQDAPSRAPRRRPARPARNDLPASSGTPPDGERPASS